MTPTCTSCGRDDDSVEPVRRVYVLVGDGGEEVVQVEPEEEHWCASCRGTYPHRPA